MQNLDVVDWFLVRLGRAKLAGGLVYFTLLLLRRI
jgi:hypothetical protein